MTKYLKYLVYHKTVIHKSQSTSISTVHVAMSSSDECWKKTRRIPLFFLKTLQSKWEVERTITVPAVVVFILYSYSHSTGRKRKREAARKWEGRRPPHSPLLPLVLFPVHFPVWHHTLPASPFSSKGPALCFLMINTQCTLTPEVSSFQTVNNESNPVIFT